MYEFHPFEEKINNNIECNHCNETFKTQSELMVHKKFVHIENLQLCINFNKGKCTYGDECWFSHDPNSRKLLHEFRCNFCDENLN